MTSRKIEEIFEACVAADEGFDGAAKYAAELIAREYPVGCDGGLLDVATMRKIVRLRPRDMYAGG